MDYANLIGLIGAGIYLISYFLLALEKVDGNGILYMSSNGVAAALMLVSLNTNWNLPSVVIQASWVALSLYGVSRITFQRYVAVRGKVNNE